MVSPLPLVSNNDLTKWFNIPNEKISLPSGYNSMYWRNGGAVALAEICEKIILEKGRKIKLFLPGYFCGQSLRYLRNIKVELDFYPLTSYLTPDYSFIRKYIEKNKIDVFLLVHYFGRISSQLESRNLADENNVTLIEDCAHIISPTLTKKWYGDYLIFSPHKHYPLPLISLVLTKEKVNGNMKGSSMLPVKWVLKQIVKYVYEPSQKTKWGLLWSSDVEALNAKYPPDAIVSVASNYLLRADWYAQKRKNNAIFLLRKLGLVGEWQPLFDPNELSSVYLLAMLCDTEDIAKRRYNQLNKKNRTVMQWPDLPVEIKNFNNINLQSINCVKRILFFYVHQNININLWLDDIENIILMNRF